MTKYPLPSPLIWLGYGPRLPELTGSHTRVVTEGWRAYRKRAGLVRLVDLACPDRNIV